MPVDLQLIGCGWQTFFILSWPLGYSSGRIDQINRSTTSFDFIDFLFRTIHFEIILALQNYISFKITLFLQNYTF